MSAKALVIVRIGMAGVLALVLVSGVVELCAGRLGDYYLLTEISRRLLMCSQQCTAVFGVAALVVQGTKKH